jgi:hypothetical protein
MSSRSYSPPSHSRSRSISTQSSHSAPHSADGIDLWFDDDVMPIEVMQGIAYEVHNFMDTLDKAKIIAFLDSSNLKHATNKNAIGDGANLFSPLLTFVDKSALFIPSEKEDIKQNLLTIQTNVLTSEYFASFEHIIRSALLFVSKQDDEFIEQYIRIYKDECLNAYGHGGRSCIKGMVERVVTGINSVAILLSIDDDSNALHSDIKKLFMSPDFNEVVQKWASIYLDEGEGATDFERLSDDERRDHFISFMIEEFGTYITDELRTKIYTEAENYERMGIFKNLAFGVKPNKSNKKKPNKSNKKKPNKSNKKKPNKSNKSNKRKTNKRL